ncbi:hypothetical protein JCM3765_006867 [Sporobolomyces pararoseus]
MPAMVVASNPSSSHHSRSLPLPSSLPIPHPISTTSHPSLPVEQLPETPTPRSRQTSNTPSKPTPLATFRLPANPHPSTPSRTAPSTPSRSSAPRIVHYTSNQFVEFEPFVASPPTYISPLPQPSYSSSSSRYLGVPSFMSSTSSVIDSDGGFEHFERAESTLSDATYDGGYAGAYECSASSDAFYSSTPSHSYTSEPQYGDYSQGRTTSLGKRSWSEVDHQQAQGSYTPSRRQEKRIRVEPITPITPSSSYTTTHHGDYSSVARTLSYGTNYAPMPSLHRANTYSGPVESQRPLSARSSVSQNDVVYPSEFDNAHQYGGGSELTAYPHSGSSSPRTDNTPFLTCTTAQTSYFENTPCDEYPQTPALLASPLLIPQSAPIERGHFQPYPDLEATQMSLSYSLPHPPQQFHTTPRQGRTIHSKREEFDLSPTTPRRGEQTNQNFQLHSPVSPNYVSSHSAPALVPIPSSSTPPSLSRRSSSTSNYTPNQAALVSAASMNRLLSRFDPNSSPIKSSPAVVTSVEVPVVGRGVCAIHPRYRVPPPPPRASPTQNTNKNDKLHTCVQDGCGRKFKRLEHLKRHERTHTMEKPYGCDIPGCGRYFSRSDNLAQHRKTHDRNGKTSRAMAAAAAARENAARAAAEAAMANHSMVY